MTEKVALLADSDTDSKTDKHESESRASIFDKQLWLTDGKAISILMVLYIFQGVPLGLCGAIPYMLTSRGVSYDDQAIFSFSGLPFSMKLLWAPFVDGFYSTKFGRRKTWLVPVQLLIGFGMLLIYPHIDYLIENSIFSLTVAAFMFTFLAATQDIAVDGWCLTMLSKSNVGWASTCNAVGQTIGYFLGNSIFLALESADFSDKWVRPIFGLQEQKIGLVTLPGYFHFWGWLFIIGTTLVSIRGGEI